MGEIVVDVVGWAVVVVVVLVVTVGRVVVVVVVVVEDSVVTSRSDFGVGKDWTLTWSSCGPSVEVTWAIGCTQWTNVG